MRDDDSQPSDYPFDWTALARRTMARLRREESAVGPVAEFALRGLHGAVNTAGWRLDDIVDPEWREASFTGPVFILGHQRSATTFLHRALVEDVLAEGAGLTLAEMLAPPLVLRRLGDAVAGLPAPLEAWVDRAVERLESDLFGPIEPLHRTRFDAVEEDEFALMALFASGMCANDRPSTLKAKELDALRRPESRPARRQEQTLKGYRAILRKRAALDEAESPVMVAKNPAFSKRIGKLRELFPDARFVRVVRNPLQAIPSRLKLVDRIWRHRHGEGLAPDHARCLMRDSIDIYEGAEAGFGELPDRKTWEVRFDRFVDRPAHHLVRLVQKLDLGPVERDFERHVRERAGRHRDEGRSAKLAEWDLAADEVVEPLADIFDRWGFEGDGRRQNAA